MRTGSVSVPGAAMNTVIVTSSNELMKASAQPLISPGSTSGRVMRRSTVPVRGAERDGGMLDRAVEADGRGEREAQREGQHDHDVRQHQAGEGAAQPDLR